MPSTPVRRRLLAAAALLTLTLQGCGKKPAEIQQEKADAGLEQFLDSWARGEPADKWANTSLPVSGIDPDRNDGYRLLSFQVIETKQSEDKPQVRYRVALTLQDRRRKQVDRKVNYDVSVGDTVVIGRAP